MIQTEEKRVILLMADITKAKEISEVFRLTGVIPEFYDSLRTFWKDILIERPSLCIVDVKSMSDGELIYKHHPHVKSKKLQVLFYYQNESKPLLFSTFELDSHGYINGDIPIMGQMKSLFKRINHFNELLSSKKKLMIKNKEAEKTIDRLTETLEGHKVNHIYTSKILDLKTAMESSKIHGDFFTACTNVFDNNVDIVSYSFMEVSLNGQKLVSPKSFSKKYKELPSIWPGKDCSDGIAIFAQNLANQVSLDIMGENLIPILIKGTGELPEKMLFLQVKDEDMIVHFNWRELEASLTALYHYFALFNRKLISPKESIIHSWELFSLIDAYADDTPLPENRMAIIDLDFSKVISAVNEENRKRKVYWGKFYNDFFSKLERLNKISFRFSPWSISHVALVVGAQELDEAFDVAKEFAQSFPYWRYFEDPDIVLAEDLAPSLKMIPFSSKAILRHLEGTAVQDPSPAKPPPIVVPSNQTL